MVEQDVHNHIVILAVSAKPRCGEANKNSDKIKLQNLATAPHLPSIRRYMSSGIIIQQPYFDLLE